MPMQFYDPIRDTVFTPSADLSDSGRYSPVDWQQLRTNGQGIPVTAARAVVTWQWDVLSSADWDWWVNTFMASERTHVRCTSATAPKETWIWGYRVGVLIKVSSCIIHRPVAMTFGNGDLMNVTLKITNILI